MAQSFYQREVHTVNAKSWTTITLPTAANYFYINNMGQGSLYFSASKIPTENSFDMKIGAGASKMYVEATAKKQVYVYNGSADTINFAFVYFNAEFEPLVLALTSLESLGGGGGSDSPAFEVQINGFDAALPTGNNTIGKVVVNEIVGELPAGTNNIGMVTVEDMNNITDRLNDLWLDTNAIKKEMGYVYKYLSSLVKLNNQSTLTTKLSEGHLDGESFIIASDGYMITNIRLLSNDGDGDIKLRGSMLNGIITVKPGEVLENIPFYTTTLLLYSETETAFRLVYNEVKEEEEE